MFKMSVGVFWKMLVMFEGAWYLVGLVNVGVYWCSGYNTGVLDCSWYKMLNNINNGGVT